jgi:hypothetical protein
LSTSWQQSTTVTPVTLCLLTIIQATAHQESTTQPHLWPNLQTHSDWDQRGVNVFQNIWALQGASELSPVAGRLALCCPQEAWSTEQIQEPVNNT